MPEQPSEAFLIRKGEPTRTKEEFFRLMEQRVQKLDEPSYREKAGGFSNLGSFHGFVVLKDGRKILRDPTIYINSEDYLVNGEDFTDIIPITVRHEAFEMWTYVKNGWSLAPPPSHIGETGARGVAHGLAMRETYRYAKEIGKIERWLEFVKKWVEANQEKLSERESKLFLAENEEAYRRAMQGRG